MLHAHLSEQRWPPASLTKLMTTYLALQAIESGRLTPQSPVRMSARANAQPFNTMNYSEGHQIPLDTALRLLLVKSANDVAVAVAETVGGSFDAFVADMNATAARIGMTETQFANPNGLHEARHYSTARDMGVLAMAIWTDFPQYGPLFSLPSLTLEGQTMKNFNPLLDGFPGADGMKTGYVCESGYNLVGSAVRDGRRVVTVVLGATSEAERAEVAQALTAEALGARPAQPVGAQSVQPDPVNLRPYVCGGQVMPGALSGF
ncbi:D-alanyl-D-alanine carboxypeptidase [Lutibaculum baratangense AMV1]|uniref:D-alanyl-D-alanine carboxypeptidase n=1 Tax=Lutibaculum baratangense AMV1 TaxID=631454 RepID=V4RMN7_9HYPH|nr:D-alanyl-D-alanine carboxypeptidase [Lutibaculum baratangense AMV1]